MHVVISGANRGIGNALYTHYRAAGDTVTGTARTDPDFSALDVTDPTSQAAFAARLKGQPVDLLICNAGAYPDKHETLETGYPPAMWAAAFATNVTGVFLTVQSLLPNLETTGSAKIAIISSIMASHTLAPGGGYIYRASKAAALNLGRNLAADLRPRGISVGVYHPGWVRTDMGGGSADIDVATSAAGLAGRFDALSPGTTGCYEDWAGSPIPF